jgi:hypothetical protein
VLTFLQKFGKIWLGRSMWEGTVVIRISVSCQRTNETDIAATIELFKAAKQACAE